MQWKKWLKPAAGALLVLPVIGLDIAGIAIFAPVTLGVVVGAAILLEHFNVI